MSSDKVDDAMRGVVSDSDVAIDGMDKSMSNSTVYVTASTPRAGKCPTLFPWCATCLAGRFPACK